MSVYDDWFEIQKVLARHQGTQVEEINVVEVRKQKDDSVIVRYHFVGSFYAARIDKDGNVTDINA